MRFYITLLIAKLSSFFIRVLNIGSGYTWPGHLALKIFPSILKNKRMHFPKGVILISGTNGKTTTSKILTHLLKSSDYRVVHNRTGANLVNGIVSEILLNMDFLGRHNADYGVFEVDENNLPLILEFFEPNLLILLNLSRDQLDRYGEVDLILDKWISSIKDLNADCELVLDEAQDNFRQFRNVTKSDITYFDDSKDYMKHTNLVGSFNAKNVNAAVYSAMLLGLSEEEIVSSLPSFDYAYGRGELIEAGDVLFKILLAKNPASFNSNLDAVLVDGIEGDSLLFILNDNIPDGRDMSWIYDVDASLLKKVCDSKQIFICGSRSYDMAVRLKYADVLVSSDNIFPSIDSALERVFQSNTSCIVFPNYSAMLQLRKRLVGKEIL